MRVDKGDAKCGPTRIAVRAKHVAHLSVVRGDKHEGALGAVVEYELLFSDAKTGGVVAGVFYDDGVWTRIDIVEGKPAC